MAALLVVRLTFSVVAVSLLVSVLGSVLVPLTDLEGTAPTSGPRPNSVTTVFTRLTGVDLAQEADRAVRNLEDLETRLSTAPTG